MPGLEKKLAHRHTPAEPQSTAACKVHLSLLSLYVAEGEVDEFVFQGEYNKEVNAQHYALHRSKKVEYYYRALSNDGKSEVESGILRHKLYI